jgi:hypothetical protein
VNSFFLDWKMTSMAKKQDMPPPGGYKTLNYSRIPAKTLMGGKYPIFNSYYIPPLLLVFP